MKTSPTKLNRALPALAALFAFTASADAAWWNPEWPARVPVTLEAPAFSGETPVLVRLHSGNFDFSSVREDGSDLRFVAEDDVTVLPHTLERFDSMLGEAFVWVKAPAAKDGAPVKFNVYFGNAAVPAADTKSAHDEATKLVWSFAERDTPVRDRSGHGNDAAEKGAFVEGALIGSGIRFNNTKPLAIPAKDTLAFADKGPLTLSLWAKPGSETGDGVVYSRREGRDALVLGYAKGLPYIEVTRAGTARRAAATVAPGAKWTHLAAVANGETVTLYVNGAKVAVANAGLPALKGAATLGGDTAKADAGFTGEIDELNLALAARSEGALGFAAKNQGLDGASTITLGTAEQNGVEAAGEDHSQYFKVIVDSLTFDGWVVIILLAIMAVASWVFMYVKVNYLNVSQRGNKLFMEAWAKLSRNLHAIDHGDHAKIESVGGNIDAAQRKFVKKSPIYRIFDVGAQEIRHRIQAEGSTHTISAESIEAIRARLDGAMVRETQKLDRMMVILTISISGGPFLGLLGTVVGVMITFAAVSMAGEVNINAIAPGISGALLATVAGLAVAIPALFAYNYILGRIKDVKADIQVFIDEFITSLAEFYQPGAESIEGETAPAVRNDEQALERLAELLAARLQKRRETAAPVNAN